MKSYFLAALMASCLAAFAQSDAPVITVIPKPNSVTVRGTAAFMPNRESGILFESAEDEKMARLFHDFLKANWALDIPVAKAFIRAPKGTIRFSSAGYANADPESYVLSVDESQVNVSGTGPGLFYGLQTLIQLMPAQPTPSIPAVIITDGPRYRYRGMHLDVCRHFFPVSFVKKYIDLLAQYKLNTFHWHLTDDQGWRIEIKKYPKLTSVGGMRAQTLIGNFHDRTPQWFDGTPYGGFYTQEEIRDVVAYAADRYINVIPEIEMPGHSLAALAAYPQLACGDNPGPFKTAETWGVFNDVYCPGKDSTFNFLEDVLVEVMQLFPSKYIHIGGDECPKVRWHTCPYCQKRMRDNKLKNEEQLQSYFVQRIEKFLNGKGRQIIGWNEILQGGLAPNATVMSWQNVSAGITAAKQNHDVVMSPQSFLYFDHLQSRSAQEPLSIGGFNPLAAVYAFDPTPASVPDAQKKYIIGVQANLWTEYIGTPAKVEYMIMPRMFALSEIAWTYPANKDYADFLSKRLPVHLAKADHTATYFRVPEAIGAGDTTIYGAQPVVNLQPSVAGAKIYYTLDGRDPGETDAVYAPGLAINVPPGERRTLKTVVITPSGRRSAVTTANLFNEVPRPAKDTLLTKQGLRYYYIPGNFESAKSLDTLAAKDKGVQPNISLDRFKTKTTGYGLILRGFVNIAEDGAYSFGVRSDDGSALYVDGELLIDNDGKHPLAEAAGTVNLQKGYHILEVRYFDAGGAAELRATMGPAGGKRIDLVNRQLFN